MGLLKIYGARDENDLVECAKGKSRQFGSVPPERKKRPGGEALRFSAGPVRYLRTSSL